MIHQPIGIDALARSILADYARRFPKKHACPVDLEHFAQAYLGLRIGYTTLTDNIGVLGISVGETTLIEIQRAEPTGEFVVPEDTILIDKRLLSSGCSTRLRFTLAHEIAHQVLLRHSGDPSDSHANVLAAALLMPREQVEKRMFPAKFYTSYEGRFNTWDYMRIKKAADSLRVSASALTIRLRELGFVQYKPISEYIDPLLISA